MAMPVAMPVIESTTATAEVPLLHVPPVIASLNAVVEPTQTFKSPVIAAGVGLTVTVIVAKQPKPIV